MTQYARPDADDNNDGGWENSEEDGEDMFSHVNDGDDNNYIYVEDYGGSAITLSLGSIDAPDSGTRTVTVRASEDSGSAMMQLNVNLRVGTTSVQNQTFDTMDSNPTDYSFNITSSVSDYSNLNIILTATDSMGMGTTATVFNLFFSVPDAAAGGGATATPAAFLLFVD